ncbi:type II toxin-antitoxin system death-on-curing family toxin [Actinopolymorpha alba]|uniref:type II toxin-antitoxin system death-on-curing family toxin n=1 Tax=Actinopolymorpha alba TaxID=533267 RepID=UPI0003744047|nr:type II toxin-antitoxin system death-on-curing family toxin [Actinopolymorpha alba]
MTEFLTLDDLVAAAEAALGSPEVRDWGLLEAAVARPRASVLGEDAYLSLHAKAAALLHSVVGNHALVDGNKRLGWVAVRLFYVMNGSDLRADHDEAFDLVMAVAAGELADVDKIAEILGRWVA